MRRLFPAGLVLALAAALTACGGSADSAGSSSSDGELTLYSGRSEKLISPLIAQAEKELGLKIKVRYGSSAELAAQMAEEGGKSSADLFWSTDSGALAAIDKEGLFRPLPAETLDKVPAALRAQDGGWVGTSGRARVFVVRPDAVATAPRSVFELTDPKYKGRVAITPTYGSFQTFVTAMRVMIGDAKTEEWLLAMKKNGVQTYENNIQVVQAVSDGRADIGLINHYYLFEFAEEEGKKPNAALVFPKPGDPGALINPAGIGMTAKGAKDPDALAFINYLLSSKGQSFFPKNTNEYPLVAGNAQPVGVPPLAELGENQFKLEQLADLRGTLDLLQKVGLI